MIKRKSKSSGLSLKWLAAVVLAVVFVGPALAQEEPPQLQMPGTIEGTGTYFEVTDSEYLNITLQSSESVNLRLESVPQMVTMDIEAVEGATSSQITLTGFAPSTMYYKYQDDHQNEVAFTTDDSGSYSYTQDLASLHLVFIQPSASTIFLSDLGWSDENGNDPGVGTWNPVTKTGTLTTDVSGAIRINSNYITLDGNGHTVTGSGTGYGVLIHWSGGVTVHNVNVQEFSYGIYLWVCSSNILTDNTASNNWTGIHVSRSGNTTLTGNAANSNRGFGIRLEPYSNNNTLTDNTANSNTAFGIYIRRYCYNNTLTGNTFNSNNSRGIVLYNYCNNNTLTNNTVSNNYYNGIYLYMSSDNSLTGNTISNNNNNGIYLNNNSNGNQIYNNNFIDNSTLQAYVYKSSGNVFNLLAPPDGPGGNYWSNHTSPDTNPNDGFVDIPYIFTGGQDNLPWVRENGWAITPQEAIQNLIDQVADLNLQKGIDNSLDAKLDAAFKALDDVNENNDVAAINALQAFINAVEAQRGNKISDEDAEELIATVNDIIAMLSSP